MTGSNLPWPDELAQVRAQIKALQAREAELRQLLIATPSAREGAAWLAIVKTSVTSRTDLKELRAAQPDLVDEFTFPVTYTTVGLAGITEDGELLSPAAFRKLEEEATDGQ